MSPGEALRAAVEGRLALWKRSALPGLEIPDPGHGLDEICPVTEYGEAFDPTSDADVAPFSADQVSDFPVATGVRAGTGYLVWHLSHMRDGDVVPGDPPEHVAELSLEFWIKTPAARGGELAALYTGALNLLFADWAEYPGGGVIEIAAGERAPATLPLFDGQDLSWRYDKHQIPLTLHYRVEAA